MSGGCAWRIVVLLCCIVYARPCSPAWYVGVASKVRLSAQGRPGLDPGVVVGIILTIPDMATAGLLVVVHLCLLVT